MGWHIEVIAAKLAAVREGKIRRLVINLPPRHLKSLLASIAFPAWCLGREPSAQILCVSYAQDLADKLSRDCRHIVASSWYRQLFPATRLSPQRAAMPEFDTTAQGCRLASTSLRESAYVVRPFSSCPRKRASRAQGSEDGPGLPLARE